MPNMSVFEKSALRLINHEQNYDLRDHGRTLQLGRRPRR